MVRQFPCIYVDRSAQYVWTVLLKLTLRLCPSSGCRGPDLCMMPFKKLVLTRVVRCFPPWAQRDPEPLTEGLEGLRLGGCCLAGREDEETRG
jgi:hypothetical protein